MTDECSGFNSPWGFAKAGRSLEAKVSKQGMEMRETEAGKIMFMGTLCEKAGLGK
jgi:hypothetical protein